MDNVLLVFGGRSYEHDISIVTASQIFSKTRLENVNLVPIYISKENRFFVYLEEKFMLNDFADFDEQKPSKKFKEVVFVSGEKGKLFSKSIFGLKEYLCCNTAIIACHGGDGENGRLVSLLESHGIFSSSGGADGLAVAMNKMLFKNVMKANKIPVVSGFEINKNLYVQNRETYDFRLKFLKFPIVLKPSNGGSSIGLFVAEDKDDFEQKLMQAFEFDDNVIVEKFISGAREFNVAIMGDSERCLVSEVDEPLKMGEILSFEDKYLSGRKSDKGSKDSSMVSQLRKFPADISDGLREKLREYAKKIFVLLNLSGVSRIDFLFDEKKGKVYVCEVNSVPGSLAYYFFARGEVLINDFVKKLIAIAKKKSEQPDRFNAQFVTNVLK